MSHRRVATLLLGSLLLMTRAAAEPDPVIAGPTKDEARHTEVYSVETPLLGKPSTVEVLLPDGYDAGQPYRCLYLLPAEGANGTHGDPIDEARRIDAANRYQIICVSMSFDTVPWYGRHATDPTVRQSQYLHDVVVPLIESRYATVEGPDGRLLLGFSKSGWGAVSLLLRDPDFYGQACAWDAPLMMTEQDLKWGSKKHFGTPDAARPYVPLHLIEEKAAALRDGPPRLTILGHDLYGKDTRAFHARLDELEIPHRYRDDLRFKHRWDSGWLDGALEVFLSSR